jgi:hypothetical protein
MQGAFVFANLVADLLLFVGSSAGADDKGRRRILSITGTAAAPTFIVDWNDDVDWSDGDHLTVVHFYPPWPRYSWFTATGPDFRKDGPPASAGGAGVDYTDQNEEPPPLVIMGPHYANELTGASLAVQLSAANSQAVADGATILSYAWSIVPTAGASFDNAAIAAPILTFTVDNSKYWVTCTITDDNGKTAVGRRAYSIGGAVTEFSRGPITENYDNPSVNATITLSSPETTDSDAIRPVMTWADFADKTLVIITSEDQYGSTQKAISFRDAAQYEDHLHILYVGYLFAENDDLIDDGSGTVTLNAVSTIPMFLYSISLTGVEDASDWFEMNKELMTVAANLFHLFKYQSTLLEIMDWHLPWSDTVKRSANEEFNEGSLIDRARALIGARLMAMTAIGLGEVWVETDLNLRDSTDRTAETTTLTLVEAATGTDISGTKRARVRQYGDNIRALVDGGSSTGLLGSFAPFLSASQFIARAEGRPQMVNFSRLMLPDQTEANRLAGRIATVANGKFQEVNLELSGNYRGVFSPGDQQKIDLGDVFAGSLQANIRGYTDLENVDVIIRSVTISHANGFTSVSVVADVMQAEGLTGVTITPPSVPSDETLPGGNTGSFDPPAPPVYPPIPPNLAVAGHAVGVDEDSGIYWTANSGGSWEARNDGLSTANGFDLIWSPWWKTAFENNSSNPEDVVLWWTGTGYIRKSDDAGKSWSDITQFVSDPPNTFGDGPAPTAEVVDYTQIHGDIHQQGGYLLTINWVSGTAEVRSWVLLTTDNFSTSSWTSISAATFTPISWTFLTTFESWTYSDDSTPGSSATRSQVAGGIRMTISIIASAGNIGQGTHTSPNVNQLITVGTVVEADFTAASDSIVTFHTLTVVYTDVTSESANVTTGAAGTVSVTLTQNKTIDFITLLIGRSTGIGGGPYNFTTEFTEARIIPTGTLLTLLTEDVDLEAGNTQYITVWDETDLLLQQRLKTDLSTVTNSSNFGAASSAQISARTFWLGCYCPAFFGTASLDDIVYAFGRWDDGTVRHVSKSTDGAASFVDIGDSATWLTGWVGAFFADDANTLYAFVNGASRALYRSLNGGTSWTNLSSLPFDVDYEAVSKHSDGRILIANRSAGAQMVAYADSPYSSWTNATGSPSFPTAGGGARAIVWIT